VDLIILFCKTLNEVGFFHTAAINALSQGEEIKFRFRVIFWVPISFLLNTVLIHNSNLNINFI
jgi:hypothetical protein